MARQREAGREFLVTRADQADARMVAHIDGGVVRWQVWWHPPGEPERVSSQGETALILPPEHPYRITVRPVDRTLHLMPGQLTAGLTVAPHLWAGRLYVPLRGVADQLGHAIGYMPATGTAVLNGPSGRIELNPATGQVRITPPADPFRADLVPETVTEQVTLRVRDGVTLVPVRDLARWLGAGLQMAPDGAVSLTRREYRVETDLPAQVEQIELPVIIIRPGRAHVFWGIAGVAPTFWASSNPPEPVTVPPYYEAQYTVIDLMPGDNTLLFTVHDSGSLWVHQQPLVSGVRPEQTPIRYAAFIPGGGMPLTITSPAHGYTLAGGPVELSGQIPPGSWDHVLVRVDRNGTEAAFVKVPVDAAGRFRVELKPADAGGGLHRVRIFSPLGSVVGPHGPAQTEVARLMINWQPAFTSSVPGRGPRS